MNPFSTNVPLPHTHPENIKKFSIGRKWVKMQLFSQVYGLQNRKTSMERLTEFKKAEV